MKKKILIVGGCGFIGHNLALKLKTKKNDVLVVDNLGVNNLKSPKDPLIMNQKMYDAILNERLKLLKKNSIEMIIQDAKNFNEMQKTFNKKGYKIVETNPELEENSSIKNLWKNYEHRLHKKRLTVTQKLKKGAKT